MVCNRAAYRNSSYCCHGAAQHPYSTLSWCSAYLQQQALAKPDRMGMIKSHCTAAQPSTPLVSCILLSSSLHPHQTLSRSLLKQMRSEEPHVSKDVHTACVALATNTRELKRSDSAGHQHLLPHRLAAPVTHHVTSEGAPQSTVTASDFPVTREEE